MNLSHNDTTTNTITTTTLEPNIDATTNNSNSKTNQTTPFAKDVFLEPNFDVGATSGDQFAKLTRVNKNKTDDAAYYDQGRKIFRVYILLC